MVESVKSAVEGRAGRGRWTMLVNRAALMGGISVIVIGVAIFLALYLKTRRTRFPLEIAPAANPPTAPSAPRPSGALKTLEQRFGPERVARLVLTNTRRARNIRATVEAKIPELIESSQRDFRWTGTGSRFSWQLAPVEDLAEVAGRIDFGKASIDPRTRTITVSIDPARFR